MGLSDPTTAVAKSTLSSAGGFGGGALKRSHSVKTDFPSRKSSWGGTKQIGLYADSASELDKENSVLEEEEDEDGSESENGTQRRSSYAGTFASTDEGTESYAIRSVTDSAVDERRTSFAPSTTLGTIDVDEDDEEEGEEGEEEEGSQAEEADEATARQGQLQLYTGNMGREHDGFDGGSKELVPYGITDSGLGTEPPTAALEGGAFFGRE